jgi:NhaP-type Na+/H+ or K+/H+ antiporter
MLDVVWRLAVGACVGWLAGWLLGYAAFRLPKRAKLSGTGDGFVALGITCLTYALTELAHGYGFVGVFVAALTLRGSEREHRYHAELHAFAEQVERLLMMVPLVCFGAAIAEGSIFGALSWPVVGLTALVVLVVRPAAAWISLAGGEQPAQERAMIAFFGIRGLGSFYYLAEFDQPATLWVTVCLVVLVSIVVHAMRLLDRQRRRGRDG